MKHLLDVNFLLAALHAGHTQNAAALAWLPGKTVAICPLSELGFLRISTQPKAFGATMEAARAALETFRADRQAEFLADDLPALDSHPAKSDAVTDHYLADLAQKHGWKLATFDAGIKHPAVVLVT